MPRAFVSASCALLLAFLASSARGGEAVILTYRGPIGKISAEYIARGISEAEERGAAVIILRLDTPGGLDGAMREIIQEVMNSSVPVVVYVAPKGAHAASAGCLIVLAADVAAMAPGTNLGAAHPVYISGEKVSEKILNDATAYARSLAAARGRNADWAERAVRENASIDQDEALRLKVVELVAQDVDDLLRQLDGRPVPGPAGERTLQTAKARPVWLEPDWREKALDTLANPTLAYLLLLLGVLGLIVEILTPGGFLAGTFGALALLLGLVGLSNLPVQVSGAALLLLGMVFFILELKVVSYGLLSLAGVVAFIIGSLMLFPRVPGFQVSWLAIGTMTIAWAGAFGFVLRLVIKAQRQPALSGVEHMVGAEGVVKTELAPRGIVTVEGENWTAEAVPGPIPAGERIEVLEVQGLTLRVRRREPERRT